MSSPSNDWRSSLGFTGRLSNIVRINTSYKLAFPAAAPAEAQQEAKVLEAEAFQNALSEADYHARCKAVTDELLCNQQSQDANGLKQHATGAATAPLGVDIGKYKSATHHRDGLFSNVYKAEVPDGSPVDPTQFGRLVALKVTVPMAMTAPHDSHREARILRYSRSCHVIPLWDTFEQAGGRLVLVFPFMPYDLEQLLRQQSFSDAERKGWLRDLFSALSHLHSHGVIHRDVKPSNVLLKSPSGPAYLADFGIAWWEEDKQSEPADAKITDVGTTCYRPPELLFGNTRYSYALDMWAAGCVAAEVVNDAHETLFDSGELGSELALIQSMFKRLGTPTVETWPEAATYPDWGKMEFHRYHSKEWSELLPRTSGEARNFVSKLVRYETGERLSAAQALEHHYLQNEQ